VLLSHLMQFLQMDMGDRISQEVDRRLMDISLSAPGLDHLERPEFADKIKLVRNHHYVPFSALANLNSVAYLVFGLTSALVLLGTIHPLLVLMPVVAAPTAVIQFRSYRKHFKRWDDVAPEERLSQHYLELATEPKAAKEVRLFALGPHLIARHRDITRGYIRTLFRDRLKRSGIGVVTGAAYGVTLGAAIGFIGWLALNKRATIGDVALGVQVSRMVIGQVEMAATLIAWLAELAFVGSGICGCWTTSPTCGWRPRGRPVRPRRPSATGSSSTASPSPTPTPTRKFCATCRCSFPPGPPWPWWARTGRASPAWSSS